MVTVKNSVTYIGGPTVILELSGLRLMTDPTLDPKGKSFRIGENLAYWKTEGPVTTEIGKIDFVLLSHDQHGDNLDEAGRKLLTDVQQTYTTKAGAVRLGGNAVGLSPWETINLNEEVRITATPARHGPAGSEKITGDVVGFVVETKEMQLYITGDTVFYEGIQEVAQKFHPQYVFIFAGAAKPRGPFSVTMSTNDALDTASLFPYATIIPVHFEGWSHYTETGEDLQQSFAAIGIKDRLKLLPPGTAVEL